MQQRLVPVSAVDVLHERTAIYTRDPVVQELLDQVPWPNGRDRLLEPSCGDGAFLEVAVRRWLACFPHGAPEELLQQLIAFEIHPGAAQLARKRVAKLLRGAGWDAGTAAACAKSLVVCRDFLMGDVPSVEHVVGNPPYLRYANIPEELRSTYRGILPGYALSDLLHAFLDRCAKAVSPGGCIAFVTADRWLFNSGAAQLRQVLGQRFRLKHTRRLDASTAFYRPKQRKAGTPARVHPVVVTLMHGDGLALGREPFYPGAANNLLGPPLGEVAKVRLAPWLGKPGIFLVDAETASHFPAECVVPAIDTEEIRGEVLGPVTRYAIRTLPEQSPPAAVLQHLRRELPRMAERGRRQPEWLPPESWHSWDLGQETLVVPRITKRLRTVRVPAGILPTNHSISIIAAEPGLLGRLEAFLNGPDADAWIRQRAPPLEGGYLSITTSLLRQLPVPSEVAAVGA